MHHQSYIRAALERLHDEASRSTTRTRHSGRLSAWRVTGSVVRSDTDERTPLRVAYGVGLDTCSMVEVDPERFEVRVSEALDGIPRELGELMSNVAVTVQHHPQDCPCISAGVSGPF